MRYLILIAVLLLSGCVHLVLPFPDYYTKGISVVDKTSTTKITREQLNEILDLTYEEIGGEREMIGWYLFLTSKYITQEMSDGRTIIADGVTDPRGKIIFIMIHSCVWDTSLPHEIAHATRGHYHKDINFLDQVKQLTRKLRARCPRNYKRERPKEEINGKGKDEGVSQEHQSRDPASL
jgi:hypothetical protein